MGVSTRPYFFTLCVCVRLADKWGHRISSVPLVWGGIAERATRSLTNPWKPGRKLSTEGRLLGWTDSGYHYKYSDIHIHLYLRVLGWGLFSPPPFSVGLSGLSVQGAFAGWFSHLGAGLCWAGVPALCPGCPGSRLLTLRRSAQLRNEFSTECWGVLIKV